MKIQEKLLLAVTLTLLAMCMAVNHTVAGDQPFADTDTTAARSSIFP